MASLSVMDGITMYDVPKVALSLYYKYRAKDLLYLPFVFQRNSTFYLSSYFMSNNFSEILLGFLVAKINYIPKCKSSYGFIQKNIHTFYKIIICKAVGERIQNSVCCIFFICAKLGLLWQPESHPVPVAMVEKA